MKHDTEIKPIRLVYEPTDRSAINSTLQKLEANAIAQTRQLAILAPEIDAIRRDASGRGSTEHIVDEFLRNPSNFKTDLAIAFRELNALQRQVSNIVPVIADDSATMESAINRTIADLINQARTKAEMHIQAWFSATNLPLAVNRTTVVEAATALAQKHCPMLWGDGILSIAHEASLCSGQNSASQILQVYRAQLSTLRSAKDGIERVAKEIEAL